MKKPVVIAAIVVVLLLVVALIAKKSGWVGKPKGIAVAVEPVSRKTITEIITANGKIEPETEVKISPDVSGEITELGVKEGDAVADGQLLLKIQPDIYQSALERAQASLNSAQSNLANQKARAAQTKAQFTQRQLAFERSKRLFEQKAISQADFENAKAAYEVAQAEVEAGEQSVKAAAFQAKSAAASLREAQENLRRTSIYAPMSGNISRLNVEKGERVVGTKQMAGTEMLRIANLARMELKVEVNENDILKVSLADTAVINIDAYPDETFKGLVTEIANSAKLNGVSADQVTNFDVKILLLPMSYQHLITGGTKFPFRPGMSATADIQTETKQQVLCVPLQAVTTRADTSLQAHTNTAEVVKAEDIKEVVFIAKDGKALVKYVSTGIQDNDYIEVSSGLTEDMRVISAPYKAIAKRLKNQMPITPVAKDELFKKK